MSAEMLRDEGLEMVEAEQGRRITLTLTEEEFSLIFSALGMEYSYEKKRVERWNEIVKFAETHPPLPEHAAAAQRNLVKSRELEAEATAAEGAVMNLQKKIMNQRWREL